MQINHENNANGGEWKIVTPRRRKKQATSGESGSSSPAPSINDHGSPIGASQNGSKLSLATDDSETASQQQEQRAKISKKRERTAPLKTPAKKELPRTPLKTPHIPTDFPGFLSFTLGKDANQISTLDFAKLGQVRQEFQDRYPNRVDLQLQAILEHTNIILDSAQLLLKPFGAKSFCLDEKWRGGILDELSEEKAQDLVRVLECFSDKDLNAFFSAIIVVFFEQQKQVNPALIMRDNFAHQLFIQILLRHFRRSVSLKDALSVALRNYPHFRASPQLGNSILWLLSQSTVSCADDFATWFQFCLSSFGEYATSSSSVFQSISLDVMENLLRNRIQKEMLLLASSHVSQLLLTAYSQNHIFSGNKRGSLFLIRLQKICMRIIMGLVTDQKKAFLVDERLFARDLLSIMKRIDLISTQENEESMIDAIAVLLVKNKAILLEWSELCLKFDQEIRTFLTGLENRNTKAVKDLKYHHAFHDFLGKFDEMTSKRSKARSSDGSNAQSGNQKRFAKLKKRSSFFKFKLFLYLTLFVVMILLAFNYSCNNRIFQQAQFNDYCAKYNPIVEAGKKQTIAKVGDYWHLGKEYLVRLWEDPATKAAIQSGREYVETTLNTLSQRITDFIRGF